MEKQDSRRQKIIVVTMRSVVEHIKLVESLVFCERGRKILLGWCKN